MPLDDADKTIIADIVKEATKGFISAEDAGKLVTQSLDETFKKSGLDTLGDTLKGLNTKIEALEKGSGEGGDNKGGNGGSKDGKGDPETDARMAKLQEQLAEAEERQRKSDEAAKAAEAREKENKIRSGLQEALIKGGVDPSKVHLVLPTILSKRTDKGDPVVGLDANGNVVWNQQKAGYVDTIAVADGVTGWTQTDDGKTFLPAKPVEGTGRGAGNPSVPKNEAGTTDFGALRTRVNIRAVSQ